MAASRRTPPKPGPARPAEPVVRFPGRGPWSLEAGARVVPGGVRFRVWAPQARQVEVELEGGRRSLLTADPDGVFEGEVAGAGAGTRYWYLLDGRLRRGDPASRLQPAGVHGPSEVVDPRFPWKARSWRGRRLKGSVFYELHVGTFTEEGTFDAAIGKLPHLKSLGASMVELLPVAEFPGRRNWGYDGVSPYAPHSAYGGPAGLKRLSDACHALGLGLCLDVVYNHLGPEGNYLRDFGPYFTNRYHTPWGDALNYDGPGSDGVRRWAIENALYWVTEYRADALRLDAVNHVYDNSAWPVLAELKAAVEEQARRLGRTVLVIGESDLDDSRVIRPPASGGWGLDGQWSDDFHHAVHACLTGERGGYYADFGGTAELAKALKEGFVFDGRYNSFRGRRLGSPASDLPGERFIVCLQNHDQVGNRPGGDRLASLAGARAQQAAAVLLMAAPQTPLLFMGEEWGETRPFLYFTSHGDEGLIEAVRRGRRREFESFGWTEGTPDPHETATFERSRPDWAAAASEPGASIFRLYRALIALRRSRPALSNGRMDLADVRHGPGWLALRRLDPGGDRAAVLANLSGETVRVAWPWPGSWKAAVSTLEERFGGPGGPAPRARAGARLSLPPRTSVLFLPE